jgi:hypothetical protein
MKPVHWFFTLLGTVLILVFIGAALTEPKEKTLGKEEAPLMTTEMIQEATTEAARIGQMLSWGVVAFAAVLQLIAWISAVYRFSKIKKSGLSATVQAEMLDTIEVYFDLPLYFGLLGTVLSFVLITLFPDAGLMFAYVSTALGIVVSVILRLSYLTPYRQELIHLRENG